MLLLSEPVCCGWSRTELPTSRSNRDELLAGIFFPFLLVADSPMHRSENNPSVSTLKFLGESARGAVGCDFRSCVEQPQSEEMCVVLGSWCCARAALGAHRRSGSLGTGATATGLGHLGSSWTGRPLEEEHGR